MKSISELALESDAMRFVHAWLVGSIVAVGCAAEEAVPVGDPFAVELDTSVGPVVVDVNPAWAPRGAARFRELVELRFYDDVRFFRVVPGFVAQFGISGDPAQSATWRDRTLADEPVVESNVRGTLTFAMAGPDSRTTQLFVNYADNTDLDAMGFAVFARVSAGMSNLDAINAEYGEGPDQARIESMGNAYLDANFPNLDRIRTARIRQ